MELNDPGLHSRKRQLAGVHDPAQVLGIDTPVHCGIVFEDQLFLFQK